MSVDISEFDKDIEADSFIGQIINVNDPTFSGRCKIRVYGILDDVPDEMLPWATPATSTICTEGGGGNISIPKEGQWVRVNFIEGDIYAPEYIFYQKLNDDIIKKLATDYNGSHFLLYDRDENGNPIGIYFQKNTGLTIEYAHASVVVSPESVITISSIEDNSKITINRDSISIESSKTIEVKSDDISVQSSGKVDIKANKGVNIGQGNGYNNPFSMVNGEQLLSLLTQHAKNLDELTTAVTQLSTQHPQLGITPMIPMAELQLQESKSKIIDNQIKGYSK